MHSDKLQRLEEQCWSESDGLAPATFNNEKFATLIINQCCDMFVELRTRPADLAALDVKAYFGIKE